MISADLMERVTTYDGSTALRKDCRFIKGDFFIKNKQCFLVDGRWYRINSGKIVFDHECKAWVIKDQSLHLNHGIVECSAIGNLSFGYFTPNSNKNVYYYDGSQIVTALEESIFTNNPNFKEGVNGIYYNVKTPVSTPFTTKLKPRKEEFYSFPFNYGSEELIPEFLKSFNSNFIGNKL